MYRGGLFLIHIQRSGEEKVLNSRVLIEGSWRDRQLYSISFGHALYNSGAKSKEMGQK